MVHQVDRTVGPGPVGQACDGEAAQGSQLPGGPPPDAGKESAMTQQRDEHGRFISTDEPTTEVWHKAFEPNKHTHRAEEPTGGVVALVEYHADRLEFQEDLVILTISSRRIFRRAISGNLEMAQLPDFQIEIAEELGNDDLGDAWDELRAAQNGEDSVSREIVKWREELAG